MRSLSIVFLFVLMGFLLYSSLMMGASQNAPLESPLVGGDQNMLKSQRVSSRLSIPNFTVSNSSRIVALAERLTVREISYEEMLKAIELAAKLSLLAVALVMFLSLVSTLVVR
ncbi:MULTISPECIES: hypothetical protein [Thermococcus]|uniref:Uncharacterized protein n=1 Tax=Thermococcus barossii TaxID=54077 RepID=A0A2Z2MIS0_9EURY|nr:MULTISPECIES: hypothetical protein [Thermococcus]ASJ05623.1 hypothetical protein A3L01_09700 [Thermococcus barossii]NJE76763.1 hypothetical protein [Thermococcus sp. ES12]